MWYVTLSHHHYLYLIIFDQTVSPSPFLLLFCHSHSEQSVLCLQTLKYLHMKTFQVSKYILYFSTNISILIFLLHRRHPFFIPGTLGKDIPSSVVTLPSPSSIDHFPGWFIDSREWGSSTTHHWRIISQRKRVKKKSFSEVTLTALYQLTVACCFLRC